MRINFEKNENGCFTDINIINYSLNDRVVAEQVLEEIKNMTFRCLHDIYEKQNLFVVVSSTDDDGNVQHEIVRSMLTHTGDCPLDNGTFITIDSRMFDATEPDFVFTDFDEAKEFMESLLLVMDMTSRLEATMHLLQITNIFVGSTTDPVKLKKLKDLVSKMKTECENITTSPELKEAVEKLKKYIPE